MKSGFILLLCGLIFLFGCGDTSESVKTVDVYQKGTKVQAALGGFLTDAIITDYKDGKYKVHFEGYGDTYDDWFTAEQLQLKDKAAAKVSAENDEEASGQSGGGGDGEVYVRSLYDVISGGNEISWWYFGENGTVVWNPMHGVDPINMAAEEKDNFNKVGTYVKEGNMVNISWISGYKVNYKAEYKNGDFETLDGGLMVKLDPLPANYRLQGSFTGTSGYQRIASANTYVFSTDGRISVNKVGYISDGDYHGNSDVTQTGTYSIKGHTLSIRYDDGTTETQSIGLLAADRLIIGSRSFSPS